MVRKESAPWTRVIATDGSRPDVIPSIIAHLRSAIEAPTTPLNLPRTLMILLYVVKELSTARLQRSRASLRSITPEIVYVLSGLYVVKYRQWRTFFEGGGDDEGGAVDAIDQTLMVIKILRRLLIAGYEFPNRDRDVCEFWSIVRQQFGDFLNLLSRDFSSPTLDGRRLVERHLFQLTKLHLTMARDHSTSFVLLPGSMELISTYWDVVVKQSECRGSGSQLLGGKIISGGDADEDEKPLLERLALRSLLLLRACVKLVFSPAQTFKYRQPQQKQEQKLATDLVKAELLTETFVRQAMELIVARLLVFGPDDLREWNEEPEEWERRDESDAGGWEFAVRPCAEKLFLDLVIHHKDLLVRPLLNVFESVSGKSNVSLPSMILADGFKSLYRRQRPFQGCRLYGHWPLGWRAAPSAGFRSLSYDEVDRRSPREQAWLQYPPSAHRHLAGTMGFGANISLVPARLVSDLRSSTQQGRTPQRPDRSRDRWEAV